MAMGIPEMCAAIAARIDANKAALGLEGVSYPALNTVPSSPWAMVRLSPLRPTTTSKRLSRQTVNAFIDVVVLIASSETTPGDAARLDTLVHPIPDLFDAHAIGGNVNAVLTGLDGSVNHIWNDGQTTIAPRIWGEAGYCYSAVITFDTQFTREAVTP